MHFYGLSRAENIGSWTTDGNPTYFLAMQMESVPCVRFLESEVKRVFLFKLVHFLIRFDTWLIGQPKRSLLIKQSLELLKLNNWNCAFMRFSTTGSAWKLYGGKLLFLSKKSGSPGSSHPLFPAHTLRPRTVRTQHYFIPDLLPKAVRGSLGVKT